MNLDDQKNENLTIDLIERRLNPVLVDLFRLSAKKGFSVSSSDLDTIDRIEELAISAVEEKFRLIKFQARERRRNLEAFEKVRFISLGEDCFARIIPAQWGLRGFAKIGERSVPFDVAVHLIDGVIAMINDDFAGYLDPSNIIYDEKVNFCRNPAYKVRWNHNIGQEFVENNFKLIVETYKRRLDYFRDVMASTGPTVLVYHAHEPSKVMNDKVIKLWNAITARWGSEGKLLINVNTWPAGTGKIPPAPMVEGISTINVVQPTENYLWHRVTDAYSTSGVEFEYEVVESIKQAVRAKFPESCAASEIIIPPDTKPVAKANEAPSNLIRRLIDEVASLRETEGIYADHHQKQVNELSKQIDAILSK